MGGGTAAMQRGVWVKGLSKDDKAAIAATCERFIDEVLKPRFLPEIRPTEFTYPVDITGKWRGDRYSFIQRYRSGFADTAGEEFDHAFARLDHVSGERFDLMWHRHTRPVAVLPGRNHRPRDAGADGNGRTAPTAMTRLDVDTLRRMPDARLRCRPVQQNRRRFPARPHSAGRSGAAVWPRFRVHMARRRSAGCR
ncbi:hypothetical protein [Magnetospirillum sp. SS-4]|uniref:DUF3024 domain-containing protein n=1 Tax=Magnetospirillum sp. SS-4 TaxID=2681465 RepID=UPI00138577DC|nr:hypothetical protein [Magnetospirillum sp. SS-4]CAA7627256.1 hypothetical protein MTBSS4_700003 [Magnetospirillum sp. SS-4]